MLSRGQDIELDIERPAVGGAMIARAADAIVLVVGAIPGERVRARIDRVSKGVAHASTIDVLTPSPDRRTAPCDIRCGGSLYAHMSYARQCATKAAVVADAFARLARTTLPEPVPVRASPEEAYRMRARLRVRDGRLGYYLEGTHSLCSARSTRQLRPDSCDLLEAVALAGRSSWGREAEVVLSENIDASERALHLSVPDANAVSADGLVSVWGSACVTGLSASRLGSAAGDEGLTARAPALRMLMGSPWVTDGVEVSGRSVRLRRHVLGFFQGNRFLLHALAQHVIDRLEPGVDVTDLYAGCGLFAVSAAVTRGVGVVAVEGSEVSAVDLAYNAAQAGVDVGFQHESVERFLGRASSITPVVIVDPPRTGVSAEAMRDLVRLAPSRLLYVSCDVATLARDARRLFDSGYRLREIEAFDLFPNTPHVEAVAVFDNERPRR